MDRLSWRRSPSRLRLTLFFGWIPSLGVSQLSLSSALRTRGGEGTGRRRSSLSLLVVAEIACSVVLTVSVGLLVHSFWRVIHVDPGFQAQSLLRVYLRTNYYTEKGRVFWKGVLTETASLPGVRACRLIRLAARPRRCDRNVRFRGPTERSNSPAFR